MDLDARPHRAERFMPDWIVGGLIRLSLAPSLWLWARANAGNWPDVAPGLVGAAEIWDVPLIPPALLAQAAVWGAQLCVLLLVLGVAMRLVGLVLMLASLAYASWVAPEAWSAVLVFSALSFYLFARGGGALSVDGAIAAAAR